MMVRFALVLLFLTGKVFSAPSLCHHSHEAVEVSGGCHEHVAAAKSTPCNHMKECLLENDVDSAIQPAAHVPIPPLLVVEHPSEQLIAAEYSISSFIIAQDPPGPPISRFLLLRTLLI